MTRSNQAGFTLIELMISLVLFSLAVAGVLSVAVTMAQGFREQRQAVATEDNVRAPMEVLADAIRQASPAVPSGVIEDFASCATTAIAVTNSAAGPDQLDVVYAAGGVVTSLKNPFASTDTTITVVDATQISIGDNLLVSDGNTGHLVAVTSVNVGTGAIGITGPACALTRFPLAPGYVARSLVIRALRARFSIGVFDGVSNMLLMDPDAAGPRPAQPLAENVEDLQIAIGVDVNNNGAVDAGEWQYSLGVGALAGTIRAVRISLVTRTQDQLMAGGALFLRPAAEDHPASGTADGFRRRLLTSTVEVRNLAGSP